MPADTKLLSSFHHYFLFLPSNSSKKVTRFSSFSFTCRSNLKLSSAEYESKFKKGLKNIKPTKLKNSVNKMVEMDDLLLAFMISKPGGLGLCTSISLKDMELFF